MLKRCFPRLRLRKTRGPEAGGASFGIHFMFSFCCPASIGPYILRTLILNQHVDYECNIANYAGNADSGNKILSFPAMFNEYFCMPMGILYTYSLNCYLSLWQCLFSFLMLIVSIPLLVCLSIKYWMIRSKL